MDRSHNLKKSSSSVSFLLWIYLGGCCGYYSMLSTSSISSETCNPSLESSVNMSRVKHAAKTFPTDSSYEGSWDVLGMSGHGTYIFPNGVLYEGEFDDGTFHGAGELRYPSGAILRGRWRHGEITEKTLLFADGLEYSDTDWKYCRMPDRRFTIEYETGLQPAGLSYLTADQPTRKIPEGYYDTEDGFYDPKTKLVYKADDLTCIIRKSIRSIMSLEKCNPSLVSEKRVSNWENLMRKFSEGNKEQCKSVSVDMPRAKRDVKGFPTGSSYEGTWDVLGMSGYGTYIFPNGVVYEGEFDDGTFHGAGELRYPSGAILRGRWRHGEITQRTLIFADGLEYSDTDWKYCRTPDRRFTIEYENGLQPAGRSYLTADQPTLEIPEGYYDTGDGFYDPKTKLVYKADDLTHIIRSPGEREQKWIVDNCRTSTLKPLGPRPELYENWSEPKVLPEDPPSPAVPTRMKQEDSARRRVEAVVSGIHVFSTKHTTVTYMGKPAIKPKRKRIKIATLPRPPVFSYQPK